MASGDRVVALNHHIQPLVQKGFLAVVISDLIDELLLLLRGKRFHLLVLMLPFRGLSVTFVHCAQTAEDIDTRTTVPCLF